MGSNATFNGSLTLNGSSSFSGGYIAFPNTIDQTTNFERANIGFTSGDQFDIFTSVVGSGVNPRNLGLYSGLIGRGITIRRDGGSTGHIQFNVAASSQVGAMAYNFSGMSISSTGQQYGLYFTPNVAQTGSGSYSMIYVSTFENTIGSGTKNLIDLGTNTASQGGGTHTSKFSVQSNGQTIINGNLQQSGSLVVTGSIISTNGITGSIAATNGVVSGSTQITPLLPTGTISGSSQVNFTQLSGISSGIVSSSTQVTPLLPTGTISGSIQVLGGSTIHSGSANNYQFNSIGVGSVAPSGTAGRIDASGDIVAFSTSDKNFKENITPITNALEKISKISGNTYDWKPELKEFHGFEGNDVGVIAQEIEEVLPQLVTTRETGYKAVKYDKLVALLIEGIKEQQQQIHSLTLEVENLKKNKGL